MGHVGQQGAPVPVARFQPLDHGVEGGSQASDVGAPPRLHPNRIVSSGQAVGCFHDFDDGGRRPAEEVPQHGHEKQEQDDAQKHGRQRNELPSMAGKKREGESVQEEEEADDQGEEERGAAQEEPPTRPPASRGPVQP